MNKLIFLIALLFSTTFLFSQNEEKNVIFRAFSKNISPNSEILKSDDLITIDYIKKQILITSSQTTIYFFSKEIRDENNQQSFNCLDRFGKTYTIVLTPNYEEGYYFFMFFCNDCEITLFAYQATLLTIN